MKRKRTSRPPNFHEIHVALILLRRRARQTQRGAALVAGVAVNAVCHAEAGGLGGDKRGSLETVDRLLTGYGADLALCHRLLLIARRHLGDLSQIDGPMKVSRRKAEEIWAELDRPRKRRPDTSWTRGGDSQA